MADADLKAIRSKRRGSTRRKPSSTLPDTPDPIDIAMASVIAGEAGPAVALLENQNRLVLAQIPRRCPNGPGRRRPGEARRDLEEIAPALLKACARSRRL